MTRQEQKVELTGRYLAATPSGEQVTVEERTEFLRIQELSGAWSPWLPTTTRFTWGRIPLNPREDGGWETAEYEPRRLTRLR